MATNLLCPYFSKQKCCSAGSDYINLKDAKEIINVCLNNFKNCQNFILLNQKPTAYLYDSKKLS